MSHVRKPIDNVFIRSGSVYVIAEVSANHNNNYDAATSIIQAAADAGADAVKLQTYTADTITIDSEKEYFRIGGGTVWDGRTLYDLYKEAHTPWEWHEGLKRCANNLGLELFSSPFDPSAVEFLESLEMPAYKVASLELYDIPLIMRMAQTGKPLIMSTGTATLEEIKEALAGARSAGAKDIALLKCTSAYPAHPSGLNLRTIPDMITRFDVPVGLSDHTMDVTIPSIAVALGATIIEKHLTLSRAEPGPDSAFSLEPHEFKAMVASVRITESALGTVSYEASEQEQISRVYRRSLFAVKEIAAGEVFTNVNVRSIRPGQGLPPKYLNEILGKTSACDIERGTPIQWIHVKGAQLH